MAQIFGLSHLVGSVILFILYITDKNSMIRVEYALYYLFGILFFTMMFGLKIVKKLDNNSNKSPSKGGAYIYSIMIKQELFQEALSHQRIVNRELLQLLRMLRIHLMC